MCVCKYIYIDIEVGLCVCAPSCIHKMRIYRHVLVCVFIITVLFVPFHTIAFSCTTLYTA